MVDIIYILCLDEASGHTKRASKSMTKQDLPRERKHARREKSEVSL